MTVLTWAIITGIYILGYWSLYFLLRFLIKVKMAEKWTLQERLIGLVFGLVSWIGVLFYIVVYLLGTSGKINLQKEVKW